MKSMKTKEEIIKYLYDYHVTADITVEEIAEDLYNWRWHTIVKHNNDTLPPEDTKVLVYTKNNDYYIAWRCDEWGKKKYEFSDSDYNTYPEWFIHGTRGAKYACKHKVLRWAYLDS